MGAQGEERAERFTRHHRIRQRSDYLQCYRKGRRRHSSFFTLHFQPNALGYPRLGITASRKVGNAVVRHRLKRWSREIFRRWEGRDRLPGLDLVLHLKPEARAAEHGAYEGELLKWLSNLALAAGGGAR
jgi:ribonuclease P protein component